MGRLAFIQGGRQVSSSGQPYYIHGPHAMATDVVWKCTTVTGYRSPLQPSNQNLGSNYMETSLLVSEVEVFAFRMYCQNGVMAREANVFVLPWFDGLRFTSGQTAGWSLTRGLQGYVATSFIGERD